MKLNIGCGSKYLKDYINIDPLNRTIADKFYQAWSLPYGDNSVDEVIADQVIEHLGSTTFLYALSEWYKILKDDGKLIISTPDLETSFIRFLPEKESLQKRSFYLNWVFGQENKGFEHKFVFYIDDLVKLLENQGFIVKKIEKYENSIKKVQPAFKIICIKKSNPILQKISLIRKIIIEEKIMDLDNLKIYHYSIEEILEKIKQALISKNNENILSTIKQTMIVSPDLCLLIIPILKNTKTLTISDIYLKVAQQLSNAAFTKKLNRLFFLFPKMAGQQDIALNKIKIIALSYIDALLKNTPNQKALDLFNDITINENDYMFGNESCPPFFTSLTLTYISEIFLSLGLKYFVLNDFKKAEVNLYSSIKYYADNVFSYWNLARLKLVENKIPEAIIWYEKTLELTPKDENNLLIKELEDVLRKEKFADYLMPIYPYE